jgi:hypothetical protein
MVLKGSKMKRKTDIKVEGFFLKNKLTSISKP